jgi:protein-S-isoprenylcysteine O-methyltransferase Ste14
LFHPLIMPSLGLLIILNSGTYLSLYDPAAKRAVLFVMALGTLVFPLMMLPILYYRSLVTSYKDASREERLIPQVIILVLYIITFVYFQRLPLNRVIHAYVLSAAVLLFLVILLNLRFHLCIHSAALGGNLRTGHCFDFLI